jgi:hypothetical protein
MTTRKMWYDRPPGRSGKRTYIWKERKKEGKTGAAELESAIAPYSKWRLHH